MPKHPPSLNRAVGLIAAAAILGAHSPASATEVLLLSTGSAGSANDAALAIAAAHSQLSDSDFSIVAGSSTPSLATLTPFDTVLLWAEVAWDSPSDLGDVLAQYLTGGGSLVLAGEALLPGTLPTGEFLVSGLSPTTGAPAAASVAGDIDLSASDTSHPLLAGLSDVRFPDRAQGNPALSSVGVLVAVDSLGNGVVFSTCTRQVVAVNIRPSDAALPDPPTSSDVALLLGNALVQSTQRASASPQITGPATVGEGGSITLDASSSGPGDLGPLQFAWDLDGDGLYDDASTVTALFDASSLNGPQSQTAGLETEDSCGRTEEVTTTLSILNLAPSAPALVLGGALEEGNSLSLSASATDPGGDTLSYTWDFGDGSPAVNAASTTHSYADDGAFTLSCTVDDGEGGTATSSQVLSIVNVAPTVDVLSVPSSAQEGASVPLSAQVSDPGQDTVTAVWNFGDGSPSGLGLSLSHSWEDEGSYTVTLTVDDAEGGQSQSSAVITISNVAPTIDDLQVSGTQVEGEPVTFVLSASDPGQDTLTANWDFGDASPNATGLSATHSYDDDGTYTVTAVVSDGDGGSDSQTVTLSLSNAAPTWVQITGDAVAVLGESSTFQGSAADVAGDSLSWTWDFGDSSAPSQGVDLSSLAHTWTDPGTYTVTVTVEDGDGGSISQILSTSVTNPGPSLNLSPPSTLFEAVEAVFQATAADAFGDPVELDWSWGDGTPNSSGSNLVGPSHSYADDGSYSLVVQATDGWGAEAESSLSLAVANQAPVLGYQPVLGATEGVLYLVEAQATDPAGEADSLSFGTNVVPASASADATTLTLSWTPTLDEALAGPVPWTLSVVDEDGGEASLSWEVTVQIIDDDSDGMPDTWEAEFGLDPTTDDSALDLDGDGVSNLEEWTLGGNPVASNAPTAPVPLSPLTGSSVATATPALVLAPASDPDGEVLTTHTELYGDAGLTQLLESGQASGDPLSYAVQTPLTENSTAHWRARAEDASAFGPWTETQSFFVDVANDAPSVPTLVQPTGTSVATRSPRFVASSVQEPEGEDVALFFSYSDLDSGGPSIVRDGIPLPGEESWEAAPDEALVEGHSYSWTAWAEDVRGASSPLAEAIVFVVDATNDPPPAPTWTQPAEEGLELAESAPDLCVLLGDDDEGDELSLQIHIDQREDFGSADRQDLVLDPAETGEEQCLGVVTDLEENQVHYLRARSLDDGGAASPWSETFFRLNATEEAPSPPVVVAPGDGEVLAAGDELVLRWAPSVDPEGDVVLYRLEVRSGDEVLWSGEDLFIDEGSSEGEVAAGFALASGGYEARAQGVDAGGLSGAWGPSNRFSVLPEVGVPLDLSLAANEGCQCSQAPQLRRGSWAGFGVVLFLAWTGLRRRTRSVPA